jgi:hypothetical protein
MIKGVNDRNTPAISEHEPEKALALAGERENYLATGEYTGPYIL